MALEIIKATTADIPVIVGILTEAVQYKLDHQDNSWGSGVFTDQEVKDMMATNSIYLACLDSTPVGTFKLQWEDQRMWGQQPPNAGYIHLLAVTTSKHGQGLGEQIINWALAEVAKNHRQFLRLDCDSANAGLCKYYEKQGFKQVDTKKLRQYKNSTALYERQVN